MKKTIVMAALACTAIASTAAAQSLTSTFAAGNGQDGAMFDLTVLNPNGIEITGFDYRLFGTQGGPQNTIEVWYVTNHTTFVGVHQNQAAWTLMGTDTITTTVFPPEMHVNIGGLQILFGETVGIYFTEIGQASTAVGYTNGPLGAFSNADLVFEDRGRGGTYPFGSQFSVRVWNGTIYYTVIPAPASLALLGLGGLVAFRRRR